MARFAISPNVAIPSSPLRIAVNKGGRWPEIDGIETSSLTGGAKSESESETLDGGRRSSVGAAGPQDLSVALRPNTGIEAYRHLGDLYRANTPASLRIETSEQWLLRNVIAANTLAVEATADATSGLYGLTAAGDIDFTNTDDWPIGTEVVIQGSTEQTAELFMIEAVASATAAEAAFLGRFNDGAHAAISASSNWLRLITGDRTQAVFNILEFDGREFAANESMGNTMVAKMVNAPTEDTYTRQWSSWTAAAS